MLGLQTVPNLFLSALASRVMTFRGHDPCAFLFYYAVLKEQLSPVTNQNILDIHEVVQEKNTQIWYLEFISILYRTPSDNLRGKTAVTENHRDGRPPIHGLTKGNPLGST